MIIGCANCNDSPFLFALFKRGYFLAKLNKSPAYLEIKIRWVRYPLSVDIVSK